MAAIPPSTLPVHPSPAPPPVATRRPWPRALRWAAVGLGALVLLLVAAWLALWAWLPNDEQLAQRFADEAARRLGVPVQIESLRWQLVPLPVVTLTNLRTQQASPMHAERIELHPDLAPLLGRRVVLRRVVIDGAQFPQTALRELKLLPADPNAQPGRFSIDRLVLKRVDWVQRNGTALPLAGEIVFDARNIPNKVDLVRTGFAPQTHVVLTRRSPDVADGRTPEDWAVELGVGGGRADGAFTLEHTDGGRILLKGQLKPEGVEVKAALESMGRRAPLTGHARGQTTLAADADGYAQLLRTLQTTTRFEMADAVLLKFDLDRAVRTAGKEHAGQTRLDRLTGTMHSENTPRGIVVTYTDLKGSSGAFTATGQATLARRQINADLAVDLVDGVVGVPLKITGAYDNLQVSAPGGAVAGAVVGTAVLPGVGTAIGARIGATLGRIFGGPEEAPKGKAPKAKTPEKGAAPPAKAASAPR